MSSSEDKSSFAMGLSIAEVFLLLIFATFIYFGKLSEAVGNGSEALPVRIQAIMARLDTVEKDNKKLEDQIEKLSKEKKHLKDLLEVMVDMLGSPPSLVKDVERGLPGAKEKIFSELDKRLIREVRLCAEDNTLINVSANNGKVDVVILTNAVELFEYLTRELGTSFEVGDNIDWENITPFLKAVFRFETQQDCRYFFNLEWTTSDDHVLLDQFEKYLYKNKIKRVGHS